MGCKTAMSVASIVAGRARCPAWPCPYRDEGDVTRVRRRATFGNVSVVPPSGFYYTKLFPLHFLGGALAVPVVEAYCVLPHATRRLPWYEAELQSRAPLQHRPASLTQPCPTVGTGSYLADGEQQGWPGHCPRTCVSWHRRVQACSRGWSAGSRLSGRTTP